MANRPTHAGLAWGREICGRLELAESREWLCANGLGGFASGTVAGLPTRRYHGLLVAALTPPLGRTLLVSKADEAAEYADRTWALGANRWADGTVDPHGYSELERFELDGTTPVWTYALGDARLEKRIWMEPGANTTWTRYRVRRSSGPVTLHLQALVNYRDYHGTTRGNGWHMDVEPVDGGVRVTAYHGAHPVQLLCRAPGGSARVAPAHTWFRGFHLACEAERGLEAYEDHLHVATFTTTLAEGETMVLVASAEARPPTDVEAAWRRRARHEADVLERWDRGGDKNAPAWIRQLVLAADQFVARRPRADDPDGMTVIAGYHWFADWGRDTMIALPGLTLATGRADIGARILRTFARFVDRGMLPNRFPDTGETPEYNTVDASLWYFEAVRAHYQATGDARLVRDLYPVLETMVRAHLEGTRYGIGVDPADGLVRAGEPGVQLTWMDAKVGDWVVTPRMGKPVEVNALWYNALRAMAELARAIRRPSGEWETLARRAAAGFGRFWNAGAGHCFDVIDGPDGDDSALRPNQILAAALPASPLDATRRRAVVDACARHLLTSFGLRSLAPGHPAYRGRYGGDQTQRDGSYHQGTVWGWLLGPFALAHFAVYGDAVVARSFLSPMADHLTDYGVGSISEIFDGDAPFPPRGCIAQAWSVAETLRAWRILTGPRRKPARRGRRG
ncbi:MAG: amylo-alpha-1,6-glucosidase [Candidatus Rokuibacteriota bacterium]